MATKSKQITLQFSIQNLQASLDAMRKLQQSSGGAVEGLDEVIKTYSEMIEKITAAGNKLSLTDVDKIATGLVKINKTLNESSKLLNDKKKEIEELVTATEELQKAEAKLNRTKAQQEKSKTGEKARRDELTKAFFTGDQKDTNGNEIDFSDLKNPYEAYQRKLKKGTIPENTQKAFEDTLANDEKLKAFTKELEENTKALEENRAAVRKWKAEKNKYEDSDSVKDIEAAKLIVEKGSKDSAQMYENLYSKADEAISNNQDMINANVDAQDSFNSMAATFVKWRLVWSGIRKIGQEAIRTIKQMDEAITGLTVVTGKSRLEALEYVDTFRKISVATSSTMTEVANLTTEYLRQGRTMKDALNLAEETAKAAKISGLSTADTIQYMTAAINGFNLAADSASHVSDVFANVAAKSATNYEQLATALSKVSAQANLAGMSMEYTTALLAKGIETTQEAPESIGTALKTVLARMRELTDYGTTLEDGASVNKVERALAAGGIALRDSTGSFRDLTEIFNELGPKWDTLNTMQQQAIAQAVAGTRQQARFIAIMQDWDRTLEITTEAQDSANAANYQASQYQKGLEATTSRLQTAWQGFTTSIVSTEALVSIIDMIGDGLNDIASIMSTKGIQTTVRIIMGAMVVIAAYEAKGIVMEKARAALVAIRAKKTAYLQRTIAAENKSQDKNLLGLKAQTKEIEKQIALLKQKGALEDKASIEGLELQKSELQGKMNSTNFFKLLFANKEETTGGMINAFANSETAPDLKQSIFLLRKKEAVTKQIGVLEAAGKNDLAKNLKCQQQMASSQAKQLGLTAGIMIAVAGTVVLVKKIADYYKKIHNIETDLQEIDNKLYENKQKRNNLQDLITEYRRLQSTMNKTADEQERMKEIEESFESDYGITTGDYLEGAYDKLSEYYQEQSKLYADQLADAQLYYNHYGDIENKALQKSLKARMDYYNKIAIMQAGLGEGASTQAINMSDNLTSNVNYEDILKKGAQNVSSKAKADAAWASYGAGIGTGTIGGAAAGALIGTAFGPLGAGIGAGVGAIVGAIGGLVYGIYAHSEKYAKKVAVSTNKEMNDIQTEIVKFSTLYGERIETLSSEQTDSAESFASNLALRAEAYKQIIAEYGNSFSDITKEAMAAYQESIQLYLDNSDTLDKMASVLGLSDSAIETLIEKYSGYGKDVAQAFINSYKTAIEDAQKDGDMDANVSVGRTLYEQASDSNSELYKQMYESEKQRIENEIKAIENTSAKVYKNQNGLDSNEQAEIAKQNEIAKLEQELATLSSTVKNQLRSDALDFISPIQDLSAFNDRFTSLTSVITNLDDLIKQVKEGDVSSSTIQGLQGNLEPEQFTSLVAALDKGDTGAVMSQLLQLKSQFNQNNLKVYESAINRQKVSAEGATGDDKALYESTIAYMEKMKKLSAEYTEEKLKSLQYTYLEQKYTKEIEDDIISAYEGYDKLLKDKLEDNKASIAALRKGNEIYDDLLQKQRQGQDISEDYAKLSEEEQRNFYLYAEAATEFYDTLDETTDSIADNYKKWQDALVKLQDTITSQYKTKLKEEQEALKDSLNRRKELYKKYFDALSDEENEEDFLTKQARLQRAIANLASASDSASLSKRKEYEEQLEELESDYRDNLRSQRESAVTTNLENQADAASLYYDQMTTNTQKIIDLLSKWNDNQLAELLTSTSAYKNASDASKAQMMDEWLNNYRQLRGFSNGGRVDFTGPAMLHGTPSSPEWVLNSQQASALRNLISPVYNNSANSSTSQSVNIEGLNIVLNGSYDGSNAQTVGDSLAQALFDGIRRTGIAINIKK